MLRTGVALRISHMRGCGVHSPFAYRFVREVYMNRQRWHECVGMHAYEAMIVAGLKHSDAALIQRLYDFMEADGLELHGIIPSSVAGYGYVNPVCVYSGMVIPEFYQAKKNMDGVTVIISPRSNSERYEICREFVKLHDGLSLDCRSMILLFNRKGLSKEHIKL